MTAHRQGNGQCSRRGFMRVAGGGLAAGVLGFPAIVRAAPKGRRVVVLGIDGMDPALVARFVEAGRMPNTRRLIERGSLARLQTSNPPQSPVAWSNFISGTNAGGHGIFDFIAREPDTLLPYFSASRVEQAARSVRIGGCNIPLGARRLANLRGGPTFWTCLQEAGVDCTVLRMPANFPPTDTAATTLAGLGTPDIHGSYGIFSFYTSRTHERSRDVSGGHIERVHVRNDVVACTLRGPTDTFDPDRNKVHVPFRVDLDPEQPIARLSIQGVELVLQEREWSDWVRVRFTMLPHLAELVGICRFFLKRVRPDFELYVSPVNIDPRDPSLPICTPRGYARELAERIGDFYTQGMPADTSALSAGVLDDAEYREQATAVLREEMRMFESEFARFTRGFFFFYFSSLDLNSHVFWRALDPSHPLYTPELAARHGSFVPWLYEQMDIAIGKALSRVDAPDTLAVVSDHGFGPFRRQFNLNSWLMDNGYAAPVRGAVRGQGTFFSSVDWPRTRAYGLGINGLYLNVKGREPGGVVRRGAGERALLSELIERLKAVRDPKTGSTVISNVYRPAEVYSGPYVARAPDLIVGYNLGYRASWDTILGKYPEQAVLDNTDPWSGDHATDSAFMPGILISNRKITADRPALSDMAPSILGLYNVPAPEGMTGRQVLG